MKLKPTIYDKIFRRDRYRKVILLREQIKFMLAQFNDMDIVTRLSKYDSTNSEIFKRFGFTTLNEVAMCNDKGEQAVIDRLTKDRNDLLNMLDGVVEIDLSSISGQIREEKMKTILDD